MDTKAVATALDTTPRVLRRFLRSEASTFQAVGSGARYTFTDKDIPALRTRFAVWSGATPAKPAQKPVADRTPVDGPDPKDVAVWAEEGPVVLADIRDPRVRARVRRVAEEQERRLEVMLLAAGLHITQMGVRAA